MPLSVRIAAGYGLVLLVMLGIAAVTLIRLRESAAVANHLSREDAPALQVVDDLKVQILNEQIASTRFEASADTAPRGREDLLQPYFRAHDDIFGDLAALSQLEASGGSDELTAALTQLHDAIQTVELEAAKEIATIRSGAPVGADTAEELARVDAVRASDLARRMLASTPNLVAVLGPGSNEAPSTVPLINRARVPMFIDAGQAAYDRSSYAYLWRMTPSDDAAGYAMAIWAHKQGFRRGAAVLGSDASSQANVPTLVKGFQQLGGSIVVNQSLEMGKPSYAGEVEAVVQANPDVIFTEVDGNTAAIFFSELLKRHAQIPIIGTNATLEPGWLDAVSRSIGPAILAKSFVAVQPFAVPQGRAWEIFNDALLTSSPEIPNPGQWSENPYVLSDYDAVTIAALAMVAAGTVDPAVFNRYVKSVTSGGANTVVVHSYAEGLEALQTGHAIQYIGASGPMAFDQWQNAPIGFSLAAYDVGGQTTLIDSISASAIGALSR